jgi:3-oxoacyl-[acyl-carrier protein] reductase
MLHRTIAKFGKVDILINNAGIVYDNDGPVAKSLFKESVVNDWQREIDLILYGTMYCTKAVIKHMIDQKSGKIVNVSSDLGRASMGVKGASIYSTAKGGVFAFTRSIAAEVAAYDITINAVSPGMVRTTRAMLAESQKETRPKQYEYYKNLEKNLLKNIPLGRMGEPEDVAKLVVFLSSDAAGWITGQTFGVNGGLLMI